MKTLMSLAMQDNKMAKKTLRDKIDLLDAKFIVFVDKVHHQKFVTRTRESPQDEMNT